MFAYLNGKIVKRAKISIFDRGFMYGDGAFESFRTFNGKPFLLNEHLKRLSETCKFLKIHADLVPMTIVKTITRLMAVNELKEAYIKIFVTRGEANGHGLSVNKIKGKPLLLITTEKLNPQPKSCKVVICKYPRAIWVGSRLKSLNYLENILARMYAESKGANEAIFTDRSGNVLEGTTSNVFIVKNKILITPPASAPILEGVTRNFIIKLARKLKINVKERLFKAKEFSNADEAFITSSGAGIVPVLKKSGPISKKIMEAYDAKI